MKTSIINLPATYSTQQDAVTLLYIVMHESTILGYANSLTDAHLSARIHASIFEGVTLH